jgi:hypothetical protein
MPIDVHLRTHDPEKRLSLLAIENAGSSNYFRAKLIVQSQGFGCQTEFFFDRFQADDFVLRLKRMVAGAIEEAMLNQEYQTDHLTFQNDRFGHVFVSGAMHAEDQSLRFLIATDQTVLQPFIEEFGAALGPT